MTSSMATRQAVQLATKSTDVRESTFSLFIPSVFFVEPRVSVGGPFSEGGLTPGVHVGGANAGFAMLHKSSSESLRRRVSVDLHAVLLQLCPKQCVVVHQLLNLEGERKLKQKSSITGRLSSRWRVSGKH